ncbi:hypothetical protein CSPX01_00505 [Colletotrichum filicis]|nr:hypothetical protein CSPX01_00505 [Colletotrichum filicis]
MSPVPHWGPSGLAQQTNTGPDHHHDQRMTHHIYRTQINAPFRTAPNHPGIRLDYGVQSGVSSIDAAETSSKAKPRVAKFNTRARPLAVLIPSSHHHQEQRSHPGQKRTLLFAGETVMHGHFPPRVHNASTIKVQDSSTIMGNP